MCADSVRRLSVAREILAVRDTVGCEKQKAGPRRGPRQRGGERERERDSALTTLSSLHRNDTPKYEYECEARVR